MRHFFDDLTVKYEILGIKATKAQRKYSFCHSKVDRYVQWSTQLLKMNVKYREIVSEIIQFLIWKERQY